MKWNLKTARVMVTIIVVAMIGRTVQSHVSTLLEGFIDRGKNIPADIIRRPRVSRKGRTSRDSDFNFDTDHEFKIG